VARPLHFVVSAALILGAGLVHAWHLAPVHYDFVGSTASTWWIVFIAAQLSLGYALGLPELPASRTGAVIRGAVATVAAFAVIAAFQTLLATPLLPRSSSMLIGVVLPLWTLIAWNLSHDANAWAATRDRVYLVVERAEDYQAFCQDLGEVPESPATVVGVSLLEDVKLAGTGAIVREAATEARATILVLDAASQAHGPLVDQAAELHRQGVRVRTLSLFYEEWIGKLPHSELARVSLLFDIGELHRAHYVRAKRVLDLVFAAAGLLALAPVAALALAVNPVFNRGPLIYRQPRVGRDGRTFVIYKLRTMVPSDSGSTWTVTGDSRITPFGGFLRKSHLDELPQVLNILNGDLSLVGPRPEQPQYVEELSEKIAFYDVRHIVRPGLTGWAQVKQGYAADQADAFEKLQYDFYYLRRQGVALDTKIIRRTIRGVLRGDGR
jgi:lipopolysaccharide/colanic/teichoic acid biosynthesis glycosyltransferase